MALPKILEKLNNLSQKIELLPVDVQMEDVEKYESAQKDLIEIIDDMNQLEEKDRVSLVSPLATIKQKLSDRKDILKIRLDTLRNDMEVNRDHRQAALLYTIQQSQNK